MNRYKNKVNSKTGLIAVVLAGVLSMQSCYYDKEDVLYPGSTSPANCATTAAKFSANVLPLITSKCAIGGCHDATASGGRIFQNYSQISAAKDRINVRAVVEKSMPSSGPLSTAEVNIIKCWIEGGGLNN